MAWWRRRHKPTHASPPVRRQATWIQAALPPEAHTEPQAESPAVQLGFCDGSSLDLPAEDPRARALRAIADSLVQEGPVAARGATKAART
jgi:hypothetical protein